MYHPNALLKIGHDREAELVRDAQACGMPKPQTDRPAATRRLVLALAAAAPIVLWLAWVVVR